MPTIPPSGDTYTEIAAGIPMTISHPDKSGALGGFGYFKVSLPLQAYPLEVIAREGYANLWVDSNGILCIQNSDGVNTIVGSQGGSSGGGEETTAKFAAAIHNTTQTITQSANKIEFTGGTPAWWSSGTATSVVTPSGVDGMFLLMARVYVHGTSSAKHYRVTLLKNNALEGEGPIAIQYLPANTAGLIPVVNRLALEAGDVLELRIEVGSLSGHTFTADGSYSVDVSNAAVDVYELVYTTVSVSSGSVDADTTAYEIANLPNPTTCRNKVVYVSDGYESGPCGAISNGTDWLTFALGDAIALPVTIIVADVLDASGEYLETGTFGGYPMYTLAGTNWALRYNGNWQLRELVNPYIGTIAASNDFNPDDANLPPQTGWGSTNVSPYEGLTPTITYS